VKSAEVVLEHKSIYKLQKNDSISVLANNIGAQKKKCVVQIAQIEGMGIGVSFIIDGKLSAVYLYDGNKQSINTHSNIDGNDVMTMDNNGDGIPEMKAVTKNGVSRTHILKQIKWGKRITSPSK
jgi:hypothetical protein